MTNRQTKRPHLKTSTLPNLACSTRLVGHGFRLWLTGCKTGDIEYWEKASQLYSGALGDSSASAALAELSCWVKTVNDNTTREISVLSETCPGFCRDECLAVAMIAACQHKTCPAMRACAFALVEHSGVDPVVEQSERFAVTLSAVGQVLSPNFVVNAAALDLTPSSGYIQ